MIASKLRPYYAAQAKQRMEAGNNQHTKRPVEKVPQGNSSDQKAVIAATLPYKPTKARDEAGKAADFLTWPPRTTPQVVRYDHPNQL